MTAVLATFLLFLTVATLPVMGGALFAPFLLGAFLLALVGVLRGVQDRTVRQRDVELDANGWRNGG
jgi:hypothetical protein